MAETTKVVILPDNGAVDIVTWIRQQAERWNIPVAQEAAMYVLSPEQCKELGLPKQEKRARQ